jgi:hypothetical protein
MDYLDIKRLLDVVLVHQPATLYSDIVLNGTVFTNGIVVNGKFLCKNELRIILKKDLNFRQYRWSGQQCSIELATLWSKSKFIQ